MEMELGWCGTLIDVCTVLFESVITSIRLAVKLEMYNKPRDVSRARSDAWPPIGTTVPKVAAWTEAAIIATLAIARIQCLRNIRKLHVFFSNDCSEHIFFYPTTTP